MLIRPLIITVTAALLTTALLPAESSAQWRGDRQFGQRALRILGQGYSAGYHWQNPGHDSSYYNPYSAHNSNLITQPWRGGGDRFDSLGSPYSSPYSEYAPIGPAEFQAGAPVNNDFQATPPKPMADDSNPKSDSKKTKPKSRKEKSTKDESTFHQFDRARTINNQFTPAGFSKPETTEADELDNPFSDSLQW